MYRPHFAVLVEDRVSSCVAIGKTTQTLADMYDAVETYDRILQLERATEALKTLFREFEEVRKAAERVIQRARHRVGEEPLAGPVNRGGGDHLLPSA